MTQLDNGHQLMAEVVATKNITGGPVGLGTQMTERVKWRPAREDLIWEITAFESNRLYTFEADTSFGRTQVSYLFEANKVVTSVAAEVRARLKGCIAWPSRLSDFSI